MGWVQEGYHQGCRAADWGNIQRWGYSLTGQAKFTDLPRRNTLRHAGLSRQEKKRYLGQVPTKNPGTDRVIGSPWILAQQKSTGHSRKRARTRQSDQILERKAEECCQPSLILARATHQEDRRALVEQVIAVRGDRKTDERNQKIRGGSGGAEGRDQDRPAGNRIPQERNQISWGKDTGHEVQWNQVEVQQRKQNQLTVWTKWLGDRKVQTQCQWARKEADERGEKYKRQGRTAQKTVK